MRILIVDTGTEGLDWAMRCQDWGHEVVWFCRKDRGQNPLVGRGIVPRLIDYKILQSKYFGWADLIFMTDNSHYTDLLEPFRKLGYPIFGPSPDASDLELNRRIGQEAMKKAGLNTIPSKAFDDYDDAIAFVHKHQEFLVSKPSGDADKALSYVGPDAASLVYMLNRWKENPKYVNDAKKHGFLLQERKDGCEFAVGGWFGPGGWCDFWYENFEYKRLMNGDLGPNTGEMGTLSQYVSTSKLADIGLKPMTKQLEALEYVGFIDISGCIDEQGEFWPFEFTMRPGWPTFYNQIATHIGDPARWMLGMLHGSNTLEVALDEVCVSVVLAVPDFPYSKQTKKEVTGIPVYNCNDREHVHLCEIMWDDSVPVQTGSTITMMPQFVTCGDYVAVITGTGDTITGARRSAYAAVKKIKMPANFFYRTDIGAGRIRERLPKIQKHGFALNFSI